MRKYVIIKKQNEEDAPLLVELRQYISGVGMYVNGVLICAVGVNEGVLDLYGPNGLEGTGLRRIDGFVEVAR